MYDDDKWAEWFGKVFIAGLLAMVVLGSAAGVLLVIKLFMWVFG